MKSGAALLSFALLAACTDAVEPRAEVAYALESVGGSALPVVVVTDYDVTVAVVSEVIRLRSDSTFLDVTELRGVASDGQLAVSDSTSGDYSVRAGTIYFLLPGARTVLMTMSVDALTQASDQGEWVYRRRP